MDVFAVLVGFVVVAAILVSTVFYLRRSCQVLELGVVVLVVLCGGGVEFDAI